MYNFLARTVGRRKEKESSINTTIFRKRENRKEIKSKIPANTHDKFVFKINKMD